MEADT
jgi:chromosome segregation ATPase